MVPFLDAFVHLEFSKNPTLSEVGWLPFYAGGGGKWPYSSKCVVDCESEGGRGVDPGDRLKILKFIFSVKFQVFLLLHFVPHFTI